MDHKLTIGDAQVFDNVLSAEDFAQIWLFMNAVPYSRSDAQQWAKVWNLADGAILRGPQWMAAQPKWSLETPNEQLPNDPDALINLLTAVREICGRIKGMPGINRIAMLPYVWPPKSSISWHTDGTQTDSARVGAFTFYAHKEWNCEWGGEFLISAATGIEEMDVLPFDNRVGSQKIMEDGFGTWVSPKPNRLLINPSSMFHKVSKTTEGAAPRLSIQGFLYSDGN